MIEPKHWFRVDILRLWPQAGGELRGLQSHLLKTQAKITGNQLGMAIQLAEERFKQLQTTFPSQAAVLKTKWTVRLEKQRGDAEPPEEFITDLMEEFLKDLDSL